MTSLQVERGLGSWSIEPKKFLDSLLVFDMKINTSFFAEHNLSNIFLFIIISLIDSFFISDLKIKQEIKLVRVKLVKKARFYAINKAIAIQLVL